MKRACIGIRPLGNAAWLFQELKIGEVKEYENRSCEFHMTIKKTKLYTYETKHE